MLERFKNRALLLKVETVEGTDAVPTPAADAFQLFDGTAGLDSDKIEREVDRPFFTNNPFVVTNVRGFIEGGFEIVPPVGPYAAGTKAAIDSLLQIGGMARTYAAGPPALIRYNPVSTAIASATAYFYHAGTLYKMTAARSAISGIEMEIGSYLKGKCRIEGNCTQVDEASLPAGLVYTNFTTPMPNTTETMEMRINGFAVEGKAIGCDFGTELKTIEHTEKRLSRISDRKPTFTSRFYRPAKASLDVHALWKAGTIVPILGSITDPLSGLQTKLTVRGQIEEIREVDIDGDLGYEISGRAIASDTGGDEIVIEMSDTIP